MPVSCLSASFTTAAALVPPLGRAWAHNSVLGCSQAVASAQQILTDRSAAAVVPSLCCSSSFSFARQSNSSAPPRPNGVKAKEEGTNLCISSQQISKQQRILFLAPSLFAWLTSHGAESIIC
jgi:hypothetical protein